MHTTSSLKWVIAAATGVAGLYLVSVVLRAPQEWIYLLYGLSVAATIWMVIRILKDPYVTDKTFDEYFYQDRPDIRRARRE